MKPRHFAAKAAKTIAGMIIRRYNEYALIQIF